jgi:hypothetical protein
MKLFQKLIAAPAIISMASGLAVNAAEINSTDLGNYSNSNNLVSLGDFKSDTLFPGDWAYDSLKDLTNSPKFNGNSVSRIEAAVELNNLIAGGEGLMNGAAINRLSDELGSELAILKGRVDGLESRVNGIEAGSFSSTTTMDGSVSMLLGATADGSNEAVAFEYEWDIDLDTSFTGDDKLEVGIAAGSAGTEAGGVLDFGSASEDVLTVKDVNYTFPIGDNFKVKLGDSLKISKSFDNACAYKGFTDELGHCGDHKAHQVGGDQTISGQYDFDNGFTVAAGIGGKSNVTSSGTTTTHGLLTKEDESAYGVNAAYEADNYAISVAYAMVEDDASGGSRPDKTYWGIIGSYSFDDGPLSSISVGYGTEDKEGSSTDKTSWFTGLMLDEVGPGKVGLAVGTDGLISDGSAEDMLYEAYYAYDINDGMSQTIGVYYQENNQSGKKDETGIVAVTEFSF